MDSKPEELKKIIFASKEPLLFKNVIKSDILCWTLEDWQNKLGNQHLQFRCGEFKPTNEPQWERKTKIDKGSFNDFIEKAKSENTWLYFDYKYLANWFTNISDLRNSLTWAPLGFPEITPDDCTMWLGSKGAHTPCHIDTYGFNLIFQVFGRKLWILSPPEENLKPTRIPYEESSIYSRLNFFSPKKEEFKGLNNFRKIILNPGDVLLVPHKWWHYVENLETAISINAWIPVPEDDEERLKESVTQVVVKQIISHTDDTTNNHIINPNMEQLLLYTTFNSMLETVFICRNKCKEKHENNKKFKNELQQIKENTNDGIDIEKYPFIERIPKLTMDQVNLFLEEQSSRFQAGSEEAESSEKSNVLELLDVMTNSEVISLISKKILDRTTCDR